MRLLLVFGVFVEETEHSCSEDQSFILSLRSWRIREVSLASFSGVALNESVASSKAFEASVIASSRCPVISYRNTE